MFAFQSIRSTDLLMLDNKDNQLVDSETKAVLQVNNIIVSNDNILAQSIPLAMILYNLAQYGKVG